MQNCHFNLVYAYYHSILPECFLQSMAFRWVDELCCQAGRGVWFCYELCKREIGTIISHLKLNTLRPQQSPLSLPLFSGNSAAPPLAPAKSAGRCTKQALWLVGRHAAQAVAWWRACSLSTARSSYWSCSLLLLLLLQWKYRRWWVDIYGPTSIIFFTPKTLTE